MAGLETGPVEKPQTIGGWAQSLLKGCLTLGVAASGREEAGRNWHRAAWPPRRTPRSAGGASGLPTWRRAAYLAQAGREHGVELLKDTQRPELLNPALTGQCTELVCFKLASPEALNTIRKLGADRELVAALPPGSFISYNRLSGGTLTGRVF
jgi:hypothetical protein